MRTLALQSTIVAAIAIGAVGEPPVNDEGQTNSGAAISIPVLLNDPTGNTLLGVVDPTTGETVSSATLDGGASVSVSGDSIRYNPNGNLPSDGRDEFSYVTNCGTASVVVAVTPGIGAGGTVDVFGPQDDSAVTRPDTTVRIDVLRNDPENSQFTGIIVGGVPTPAPGDAPVTLPSGATVALEPSNLDDPINTVGIGLGLITYVPPAGAGATSTFTDSFEYSTQGGTATVSISINSSAAPPTGAPVDDVADTSSDRSVIIPVLDNDPLGSRLLSVTDPSRGGRPDNGEVRIRGNDLIFTPDPDRSTVPPYAVTFEYTTNAGTADVTVNVGTIGGGISQASIQLQNRTRLTIRMRVIGDPGVFFENCDISMPRGSITVPAGDPTVDPPVITLEPMAGAFLCVSLPSPTSTNVQLEAESLDSQNFRTQATSCPVELFPGGETRGVAIDEIPGGFFDPPVIGIRIICPTDLEGDGMMTP